MRNVRLAWRVNIELISTLWEDGSFGLAILFVAALPVALPIMILNGVRKGKEWRDEVEAELEEK